MYRFLKDHDFRRLILFALFAISLYLVFSIKFKVFDIPKLQTSDILFSFSRPFKKQPKEIKDIAIVAIDDYSYANMGNRWPWGRAVYARIIDKLSSYKPKVISLDMTIIGQSHDPSDDTIYIDVIKKAGNVMIGSYFSPKGEYIEPDPLYKNVLLGYGIINKLRDKDFYVRKARAFYLSKIDGAFDYGFEIKTACAFYGIPLNKITYDGKNIIFKGSTVGLEDINIPVNPDGTININYFAKPYDFRTVSAIDVLDKDFPEDFFKDKIVLIGTFSEIFHDNHNTPLKILPGVVINANEILTILSRQFIKQLPDSDNYLITVILFLATIFLTYKLSPVKGLIASLIEIALFVGVVFHFYLKDLRVDIFGPVFMITVSYLGTMGYNYIRLTIESSKLKTLAITDGLTGLFVHRYFYLRLKNEFEKALRYGNNLSLIILDVDNFKKFNDTYGHQQGDTVLRTVADILMKISRKVDVVARYGGEEFCIILPGTAEYGAKGFAERLRKEIESYNFPGQDKPLKVTASFGVASIPTKGISDYEKFISSADMALYRAKNSGRNRVCGYDYRLDKKI